MSNKFTESAEKALNNALSLAEKFGHTYIGSEHLLLSIAEGKDLRCAEMLSRYGIDNEKIKKAIAENSVCGEETKHTPNHMTPKLRQIIRNAYEKAVSNGASQVNTEHILTAIFEDISATFAILQKLGVDLKTFVEETIEDEYGVWRIIDSLCPILENVDEATAKMLESALLAVKMQKNQHDDFDRIVVLIWSN